MPSDGEGEKDGEVSAKFAEGLREGGFGYSGCFFFVREEWGLALHVEIKIVPTNRNRK